MALSWLPIPRPSNRRDSTQRYTMGLAAQRHAGVLASIPDRQLQMIQSHGTNAGVMVPYQRRPSHTRQHHSSDEDLAAQRQSGITTSLLPVRAKVSRTSGAPYNLVDPSSAVFFADDGPYFAFSNFSTIPLTDIDGKTFASAEHCFQSSKFSTSPEIYKSVMITSKNPYVAKDTAERHTPMVRADWSRVEVKTMKAVLHHKFQHKSMHWNLLHRTADLELVYVSKDRFWGFADGNGQNAMGQLLMEVRNEIRHLKDYDQCPLPPRDENACELCQCAPLLRTGPHSYGHFCGRKCMKVACKNCRSKKAKWNRFCSATCETTHLYNHHPSLGSLA